MRDGNVTKAQLTEDLADSFRRIAELEAAETERVRTEEALREALLEKDAILNSLVEHVSYQDTEMKVLWVNRAACESADLTREELVGRTCYEVWSQRSEPCPECPVVEAIETGQPREAERTTLDGRAWFIRSYPVRDEGGDVIGAVEVTLDITERKQAEKAMHRSLEKTTHSRRLLLALSQAAQDMQRARTPGMVYRVIGEHALGLGLDATVFTLSDDRMHLTISYLTLRPDLVQAAEKLTGLSAEGYRFPLTPDGTLQRVVAGGEAVFSHLDAAPFDEALPRLVRPLAERLADLFGWQQSIVAPLSTDGEVRGLLAVTGTGLTESDVPAVTAFAGQAAIAMENARLYTETQRLAAFNESIIQSMTEGIVVQDAEGRFSFANPAVASLLGYAPDELVGLHWTAIIPADQRPIVQAADARRMRGHADRYELRALRKDGRQVPILVSGTPRFDAEGHYAGTVAVFTDITELKQAEEALRDSEERFRGYVETSQDLIWECDAEGRFTYLNPAWEHVTGYTLSEMLGKPFTDFTVKGEVEENAAEFAGSLEGSSVRGYSATYISIAGSQIHLILNAIPLYDSSKNIIGAQGSAYDITERKQMEDALRANETLQQTVFDSFYEAMYVVDLDLRIRHHNRKFRQWCEQLGLETDLIGKQIQDVFPFLTGTPMSQYRQVLEAGESIVTQEETEFSGRVIATETRKTPLRVGGEITGVVTTVADITERKRAEVERELLLDQIRAQATQIQQTIDTVPEGVLLLDAAQRVILGNPVAEDGLAVLADAKVGDIITHLGDRPLTELLTSPPTRGVWHEVKADGRTFEVIARPMGPASQPTADDRLPNGNGREPEHWVLVVRDVTQERESERHIQQQERLAAVGQLAAGIAHDFNNIMAVIVLYTQMGLGLPDIPVQLRDRLQVVDQQAKRATDLIQQILDFSRRAVLERRPMDLTPFLKEVVKLLVRTVPESIKLEFIYGADEYTVNADPTRMQQAVINLVVNARDAMLPRGGGELVIKLDRVRVARYQTPPLPEMEAGEWVRVRVTDTGSGIAPEALPHIFEPFFTTKEAGKGTGLGLAQVYGIVKQHEGHIDVTTKVGEGTTFIVYLPALLQRRPATSSVGTEAFVQGQGETILIVEDNATVREALVQSVELLNYRVLEAADGREALDVLGQHAGAVSLVLSDLVMPDVGGEALFHAMRQRGLTLPVVMLSGHPMESELNTLQAQGLAGWMLKPPNIAQLSRLLARALREAAE